MIRLAVVGLGKMGVSHLAVINAHPDAKTASVCDVSGYSLDVLSKYTGLRTDPDFDRMLTEVDLDAVIIATPSKFHEGMVKKALDRGLHVFCEKPFTLDSSSSTELSELARSKQLVNQVGYHYRFVATFQEVKRLIDAGAVGDISHVLAEAYGPVVLKAKGSTWRNQRNLGGGCLYDYAAHPINLLNWYFGMPDRVGGTVLNSVFSADTDDEVASTLMFANGLTAQLSVNWSDESVRKMSTKLSFWGTKGKITVDRQEVSTYLREAPENLPGYTKGWNIRNTTELTTPVRFYLRGEEYSAQLDYFVQAIRSRSLDNINSFASAAETDRIIDMMIANNNGDQRETLASSKVVRSQKRRFFSFGS